MRYHRDNLVKKVVHACPANAHRSSIADESESKIRGRATGERIAFASNSPTFALRSRVLLACRSVGQPAARRPSSLRNQFEVHDVLQCHYFLLVSMTHTMATPRKGASRAGWERSAVGDVTCISNAAAKGAQHTRRAHARLRLGVASAAGRTRRSLNNVVIVRKADRARLR
ncbi:hypothetical protein EVAR_90240_1 [Eumeta japonica]|uniref:Uncharacterized protein n=1 Tax=Eumeta variegata TaxID=151549 RepID=A0A4C1YRY5_EUMVA|nr:hypothetical protein EVAR_90240_1 [Eumeta japonica]